MSVNCFQCRHFYITWDTRHPRGCRAYQFKTKELPSNVVKRSSGMECMNYDMKPKEADKS